MDLIVDFSTRKGKCLIDSVILIVWLLMLHLTYAMQSISLSCKDSFLESDHMVEWTVLIG